MRYSGIPRRRIIDTACGDILKIRDAATVPPNLSIIFECSIFFMLSNVTDVIINFNVNTTKFSYC